VTESSLVVDRKACAGHGLCYSIAPDVIDADDQGDPVITADPIPDDQLELAQNAVEACPERALRLEQS
jgi:ferredoxin